MVRSSAARYSALVAGFGERFLGAIAQPRQRRLQIVSDVVGDFLQPVHQRLDALKHRIEIVREPVEFVAAAADRKPAAQVAGHDALRGAGHGVDPAQHAARHEDAAAKTEDHDDQHRPLRGGGDDAENAMTLLEIAADQQPETVRQLRHAHQRAVIGLVLLVEPPVSGFGPAAGRHDAGLKRRDIARDRQSGRRRHQIKIGAGPQRTIFDGEDKTAQAAAIEDVREQADFLAHCRCDLIGDQAAGIPGEISEERGRKQREQKQIDQRQPERRGAEKFTERRHGSCIQRPGSCAAAAARNPCRSWNAAAKYARR